MASHLDIPRHIFLNGYSCKFCGHVFGSIRLRLNRIDDSDDVKFSTVNSHIFYKHIMPFLTHKEIGFYTVGDYLIVAGVKKYNTNDYTSLLDFMEQLVEDNPDFANFVIAQVLDETKPDN